MVNADNDIHDITIRDLVIEGSNKTEPGTDPNSNRSYRGGELGGLRHAKADAQSVAAALTSLGFEVRNDVGRGAMRWITVGSADQPGTSIVLHPPAVDPGITDDERRTITEMMAKGTYASILLATKDLDGTFEKLQASDTAEIVLEPTEQPYGVRDCAFRDPAGNHIRINELR